MHFNVLRQQRAIVGENCVEEEGHSGAMETHCEDTRGHLIIFVCASGALEIRAN